MISTPRTWPILAPPIPPGGISIEAADAIADLLLDAIDEQDRMMKRRVEKGRPDAPENPTRGTKLGDGT